MLEVALPICFLQVSGPSDNLHIKSQGCQGMLLFPALTKDTLSTASGSLGGEAESGLLPKLKSVTECWVVNCTEQSDNVYKKRCMAQILMFESMFNFASTLVFSENTYCLKSKLAMNILYAAREEFVKPQVV